MILVRFVAQMCFNIVNQSWNLIILFAQLEQTYLRYIIYLVSLRKNSWLNEGHLLLNSERCVFISRHIGRKTFVRGSGKIWVRTRGRHRNLPQHLSDPIFFYKTRIFSKIEAPIKKEPLKNNPKNILIRHNFFNLTPALSAWPYGFQIEFVRNPIPQSAV